MKAKWILCLMLLVVLPLSSSALVVTRSYVNSTSDNNDNSNPEDASSSQAKIGTVNQTVTTVGGSSANQGYRFTGQASAYKAGDLTQSINVTVTWTVTAEDWEEYSITISPELHAYLNIYDYSTDETDDEATFSALSSILRVNGSVVSDSLNDLTGYGISSDGSYNLNKTDSQTLSGYSGSNIFSLQLMGTVSVVAHDGGGLFDNPTGNAVLWGQDGTLDFTQNSAQDGFDNYPEVADDDPSIDTRSANDGIFVDANVTLDAVPEPASALLMGITSLLIMGWRRLFSH